MSRARDMASGVVPGSVIQVVTLENSARAAQAFSGSTFLDVYGMSLNITPKRSNSKIIIHARWFGEMTPVDTIYNSVFGLSRNGTQVGRQEGTSTVTSGLTAPARTYESPDGNSTPETASFFVTDTPNTTSTITYKMTFMTGNTGTLYTGQTIGWANQTGGYELGTCSMTAMEIAQ